MSESDEELLAALKRALAEPDVPAEFVATGKALFGIHSLDAELAALTYDSAAVPHEAMAASRSDVAAVRLVTLSSSTAIIDLGFSEEEIVGQLVYTSAPARHYAGDVDVKTISGHITTIPLDDSGRFRIRPGPSEAFRLVCRPTDATEISTAWIPR